jgi:hypothetical protein
LDAQRTEAIRKDETIPAGQRVLLSDGVLTFSEYEAAILEMARCVRAAGGQLELGEPRLNRRGLYTYSPSWPVSSPSGTEATIRECIEENLSLVSLLWAEVVTVPEQELRAAMGEMRNCLSGKGIPDVGALSQPADFHAFLRDKALAGTLTPEFQTTYLSCALEVENNWGIAGFAPAT